MNNTDRASPDRKIFYIDVGDMSVEEATARIEEVKSTIHTRSHETKAFRHSCTGEFTDISSEATRTYNFGQKGFVKINHPLYLNVSNSGGHRIFSEDGQSHYIPSGWIHLSWTVRVGEPNFVA